MIIFHNSSTWILKSDLDLALGCTTLLCDYADLKKKKAEDNSQNRK